MREMRAKSVVTNFTNFKWMKIIIVKWLYIWYLLLFLVTYLILYAGVSSLLNLLYQIFPFLKTSTSRFKIRELLLQITQELPCSLILRLVKPFDQDLCRSLPLSFDHLPPRMSSCSLINTSETTEGKTIVVTTLPTASFNCETWKPWWIWETSR